MKQIQLFALMMLVLQYASANSILGKIILKIDGPDNFNGMAQSSDGSLYVNSGKEIHKFDREGQLLQKHDLGHYVNPDDDFAVLRDDSIIVKWFKGDSRLTYRILSSSGQEQNTFSALTLNSTIPLELKNGDLAVGMDKFFKIYSREGKEQFSYPVNKNVNFVNEFPDGSIAFVDVTEIYFLSPERKVINKLLWPPID